MPTRLRHLTPVLALASLSTAHASTYGSLANFDAVNDTGQTAHGFEIELKGISRSDILDVFGMNRNFGTGSPGDVERYGIPTISNLTDASGTVIGSKITYLASYDSGTGSWSAGTASGVFNTPGESCWAFGNVGYPNVPCDHFGVSIRGTPTKTTYNWLVETGNPGELILGGVAIPSVVFTPPPPPAAGQPAQPVVAVIQAPDLHPGAPRENAYWVKIVATELAEAADLNELMAGHNAYENPDIAALGEVAETEIEWQVLQIGLVDEVSKAVDPKGNPSVVVRYEFYKYLGTFDGEGLVDPQADETPQGNVLTDAVGSYLGEQIAAFNAAAPVPEPQAWAMLLAGLGLVGGAARRRSRR